MGLFDRIKRAFTGEDEVIKHEEKKESIVIEKYDKGMEKTRRSFSDRLNEFLADFREEVRLKNATTSGQVKEVIIEKMVDIYEKGEDNLSALKKAEDRPTVLMFVGVNGVGKTTTIGKIAWRLKQEGNKVLLAAGDTFRAGAIQQLEVWGERVGVPVVSGREGGDPSSVVFDAIKKAKEENFDYLLIDTAGRLQNKLNLM